HVTFQRGYAYYFPERGAGGLQLARPAPTPPHEVLMPRLFSFLAAFCALGAAVCPQPSFAAAAPAAGSVHVLIQLKGSPLAADPNLKARTRATLYRYRLDPSLPAARRYSHALTTYQNREIAYIK